MWGNKLFTLISAVLLGLGLAGGRLLVLPFLGGRELPWLDVIVLMVVVAGVGQIKNLSFRRMPLFIWLAGLFILVAVVSLVGGLRWLALPEIMMSSLFWWRWVIYAGLIFWAANMNKDDRNIIISIFSGMLGVLAVIGFGQLLWESDLGWWERLGWDPHQSRLAATFLDPNLLGGFLVVGLALPLSKFLQENLSYRKKRWWGLLAGLIVLAVIFTYSRSALLALAVFLLIVSLRYWKVALIGFVIIGLAVGLSPRLQERITGAFYTDKTAEFRLSSWGDAVTLLQREPLLGVGYNTLNYTKKNYLYQPQSHAYSGFDSSLLTIAATMGAVGLGVYLSMIVAILVWLVKLFRREGAHPLVLTGGAATVALLAHSLFVNSWLYAPIMVLWWVILGLIWSSSRSYA